ncbi:hypothetical protein [Desulforhabdus amnigena]|uniref:hypothetical protein n=1 Tax=Desulforhabdus amnigena TaxID=40218 RepID=UPI00169EC27D|nr:hypothetical protein [Desulforhabdus amnigena]NLJ29940.1 hypothetical protein [Deltaproteobacteria bacterium]
MNENERCGSYSWIQTENLIVESYILDGFARDSEDCSSKGCSGGDCSEHTEDSSGHLHAHEHYKNSYYNDNRQSLFEKFRLAIDERHQKYAAGYQWFCRKCGHPCASTEIWIPCKGKFVTAKVICHLSCFNHWRLEIYPAIPEIGKMN